MDNTPTTAGATIALVIGMTLSIALHALPLLAALWLLRACV